MNQPQQVLVVSGKLLPRTARGKLTLHCDVAGCHRTMYALRRNEMPVVLMMRATIRGWRRVPGHPNVMLCPACAGKYLDDEGDPR